ncbi:hypothetical protein FDP41_004920 [Naegleria fowleri]|uniref:Uncharacterized protein n=1 Tax=Naegleria fowleri TaxID=5763 RepID=A0A6A5BS48_NAEFO|nr:uncharacterized protein FDP41_004920 [Naegleria fowleri]KAF0976245.1 hypothetical protein FDP41_004920 [Naegleria fowleri]CAG4718992.1 unnamed protein product [Naegleria fowleri]
MSSSSDDNTPSSSEPKDPVVMRLEANKLRLGATRKDYELLNVLGKGSFGVVFLGYSIHGSKPKVAIKKVDKELLLTEYNIERLNSEVMIHMNMKHENIVELFLYFEDYNAYYLVMEWCENGDMYKFLRKNTRFNEAQTKHYFIQIINALIYLQSFGVLHRDLKLSNMLLTNDYKTLKLSDFGLSTKLDSADEEQSTILGTPNFMAFEIVNNKKYGLKADNWSLGCILYSFLVGETPFDEKSRSQTFERIRTLNYNIPDYVSQDAKDLIRLLLHPDPTKRISLIEAKSHPFLRELIPKTISSPSTPSYSDEPRNSQHDPKTKNPFNTLRIKPFVHKKNEVNIEIDELGFVYLTFCNGERRFIVSKDGNTIWYEKKASKRKEFRFIDMPPSVEKYYEYARNVIETIKSKTPKIIYLSSEFKCIQMENDPFPDYETAIFSNGIRMVYQRKKNLLVIRFAKDRSVTIHLSKDLTQYSTEMDLTDNHKIVKVEGSLSVEESEILFNNTVLWNSLSIVKKGIEKVEQAEVEMQPENYPFLINAVSKTSGPMSPTLSESTLSGSNSSSSTLNRCLLSTISYSTNNSDTHYEEENSSNLCDE